ncbi:hypothetical protein Tco_1314394 [Tanacetum coccineum]
MRKVHTLLEMEDNDERKTFIDYLCIDLNYVEEQSNTFMLKHRDLVQELNTCEEYSNKVNQCINEQIPTQKKRILGVDQLTEDPSSCGQKDLVFVKSSADDTKVSILGVERPWLSDAKGFLLSNHDVSLSKSSDLTLYSRDLITDLFSTTTSAMSTQQDIYVAGSENRPPMLNNNNYVPWSSRLLRYAKSKPNGKLLTNDELTEKEAKQMEAKDQMMKGFDIGAQEKMAKLFNEWEKFNSTGRESIESYYHRFAKLINDFSRKTLSRKVCQQSHVSKSSPTRMEMSCHYCSLNEESI